MLVDDGAGRQWAASEAQATARERAHNLHCRVCRMRQEALSQPATPLAGLAWEPGV